MEEQQTVNKDHVKRRVKDWKARVSNLYEETRHWLQKDSSYKLDIGRPMTMHEELMEEFGLPPESIDTADIYKDGRLLASFKPKGLWIIGANGRIDLLTSKGSYILVDGAEQFQPPKWLIYSPEDKRNGKPFDKSSLLKILQ